jgi:hypothetical protein
MKRIGIVLLIAAVGGGVLYFAVPARPLRLTGPEAMPPAVRGAIHVHTRRSDGSGTPDQVAAAAFRAGLQFVILTDHDDAASEPTRPYYRRGVLLIEASEISTDHGHVVALGLPRAPYPIAGEARDVIEDVSRLGGFSIAAHPGSEKEELRWRDWTLPFDGVEWLNADSEWRDEAFVRLSGALFTYPFRAAETLAALLDRPDPVLRRWDEIAARRRVVSVAAADAHARIGLLSGEPDDTALGVHLPSYEAIFRAFSIAVAPLTLTGDAASDARGVIAAIREGHVYSTVDALATPAAMTFTAVGGRTRVSAGDIFPAGARELELRVESNAPDGARIVLFRNGEEHASAAGSRLQQTINGERAVYRTEIHLPGAPGQPPVPWVVSNPVYVGYGREEKPARRPAATKFAPQYQNGGAPDWMVGTSPRSQATFDVVPAAGGTQLSMRFGLGGTLSESPYAALVMPAGADVSSYDRLMFTARADHPMRLSVQVRVPTSGDGERWHRSVYLDETGREVTVFFDDMTPSGPTSQPRPDLSQVHAVMFVVDTVNNRPGSSGQIWIDDVKYAR